MGKCNSVTSVTGKKQEGVKAKTSYTYKRYTESFREWLQLLNYSKSGIDRMPRQLAEFFSWLEKEARLPDGQGVKEISSITRTHTKLFYHHLKYHRKSQNSGEFLKSSTLNSYIHCLKLFAHYLEETGQGKLTIDLPYEPKEVTRREILTLKEIDSLYNATTDDEKGLRERAILSLYYGCGVRSNEGIQMNLEDVMTDKKMVYVRKGKQYKERYVPFVAHQQKDFLLYLKHCRPQLLRNPEEQAFLLGNQGKRIGYGLLLGTLKRLQERTADEKLQAKTIGLHTLRHSIATHLLQTGMKLDSISRFLGHSKLRSTQAYTHLAHEIE